MVVYSSGNSIVSTFDHRQFNTERRHAAATVQAVSKSFIQLHDQTEELDTTNISRNKVDVPPEYAAYCTKFINMLEFLHAFWMVNLHRLIRLPTRFVYTHQEL